MTKDARREGWVPKKEGDENSTEIWVGEGDPDTFSKETTVSTEIEHDAKKGTLFVPVGQSVTIGRGEVYCNLGVSDEKTGMSRKHVELSVKIEQNIVKVFVKDLESTNGVKIQGFEISSLYGPSRVRDEDTLMLGNQPFLVRVLEEGAFVVRMDTEPTFDEDSQTLSIPLLPGTSITIGRSTERSDTTLGIQNDVMSRKHAQLSINGKKELVITDLSRNGTNINGTRITKGSATSLNLEDRVRFSDSDVFIVRHDETRSKFLLVPDNNE